jgi:hypothetical protein
VRKLLVDGLRIGLFVYEHPLTRAMKTLRIRTESESEKCSGPPLFGKPRTLGWEARRSRLDGAPPCGPFERDGVARGEPPL